LFPVHDFAATISIKHPRRFICMVCDQAFSSKFHTQTPNPRLSNLERPRLSSEEVHSLAAVIVVNDLHPGFPELVRPNIALVPLGPQRQARETVQVRVQVVDKGDEGAHYVEAVAAGRRRERAEEIQGDIGAVEGAEDGGLREASGRSGERACYG
jgi:hypothetical protein